MKLIFLAQIGSTLFMVGLIWFVQVVHYPLFSQVGQALFTAYETAHTRLTTLIVGPAMLVEAATAALLIPFRPTEVLLSQVWVGAVLLAIIWLSTVLVQIPQHNVLAAGFDSRAHQLLVVSNWIRTAAWSGRGLLMLWMVATVMR